MTQQPVKVALCGPPHSGKSCLREGLKQALMVLHRAGQSPYPYVLTACPDGEGAWYSEAAQRDPALAKQLKTAYKTKFTWEFTDRVAASVRDISEPLTIIDLGGMIDEKNRKILQYATHAVILAGDMAQVPVWKETCSDLNVQVIALLQSDYEGTCDRIDSETPMITGSIHYLKRGQDVSNRPMIQTLANYLVGLCDCWAH
ncbi:hypothetical protein NDI45_26930 [Leptolyngbya sp. GB1-A1]|uniref:hypothetical protein n=1 Tax=Leptolyngbya sp. GB1-A1 TaxID=2933908 RepID=UPI003298FB1D